MAEILGFIDCPTCGAAGRMRVTADRNGAPFGFCEECAQQLRIGGSAHRVEKFKGRHPALFRPAPEAGKPVTVTAEKGADHEPEKAKGGGYGYRI